MKKYYLSYDFGDEFNAGPKVRNDINVILDSEGFEKIVIKKRTIKNNLQWVFSIIVYILSLIRIYFHIRKNSILLINVPLSFANRFSYFIGLYFKILSKLKKVKIIISIIDIDSYRSYGDKFEEEWHIIDAGDLFIVHSNEMKKILLNRGHNDRKIIILEIYDYLVESKINGNNKTKEKLDNRIVFAGNLTKNKTGFIEKIKYMEGDLLFRFYGNPPLRNTKNIDYVGSFNSDDIIKSIDGSFGLVWDGDSINTCSGPFGEYLKINNPHKTSLYLAAGLPVIIWKKASMANFIEKNNLGFPVDSLGDIESVIKKMSNEEYDNMIKNTLEISKKLREGYFFRKTLKEVIKEIAR